VWEGVEAKPNPFPSDCWQAAGLSTERHYPQPARRGRRGLDRRLRDQYGSRVGQDDICDHDGVAVAAASSGLVLPCPARAVPIQKLGGVQSAAPNQLTLMVERAVWTRADGEDGLPRVGATMDGR
jgi:hypothetical protein